MVLNKLDNNIKHFVAIDLGSNSFHLIIVREQNSHAEIIYKQKQSIRLAAGLENEGMINDQRMTLAMSCLNSFADSFAQLPNCQVKIVATYALRQAKNSQKFIEQAITVMPHPINIISGEREAELIFLGVAYTQIINQPTLIIDIGGGSTEFIIGQELTPKLTRSLNIGCVSFNQRFFNSGEITEKLMYAAENYSKQVLDSLAQEYNNLGWEQTLGTSGSIKAITRIMKELYDDSNITLKRLNKIKSQLISWGHHDNIKFDNLSEKRRPLLAPAIAILIPCFELLNIDMLKYNAGGVREGLLYQLRFEQ
jgi:exopolyphosphatase/guanosine-5'-triphosphate,3'-diphosphate pyrophosphatase